MKSDADYMGLAIEKARAGIAAGQTPFGACLVKDGEVLACGSTIPCRRAQTSRRMRRSMFCGRRAGGWEAWRRGATIYSTCEPCPMCFSACLWARVSKVVFWCRHRRRAEGGVKAKSPSRTTTC